MIGLLRLMLLFQLAGLLAVVPHPQAKEDCSSCELVQRALRDAQKLKVGMTRQDIDKSGFVVTGGWVGRDRTIYVYKSCDYIKVEIEFTFDQPGPTSPKDVISKVSALEIDYPMKD